MAYAPTFFEGVSSNYMKLPNFMKNHPTAIIFLLLSFFLLGCGLRQRSHVHELVGTWRGRVQFKSGSLAAIKDLEFMYVFNVGGTMLESSNYDGVPPVPPAYGVWKRVGPLRYESRYEFYTTRPPQRVDDITKGGGWMPSGRGILTETITLSHDGRSFKSALEYSAFNQSDSLVERSEAEATASRMEFQ